MLAQLQGVVGVPHGNEMPPMKEYQARTVMDLGAQETCSANSLQNSPTVYVIETVDATH